MTLSFEVQQDMHKPIMYSVANVKPFHELCRMFCFRDEFWMLQDKWVPHTFLKGQSIWVLSCWQI